MNQKSKQKKLVILDFCETIIRFQTADLFVDFICKKQNTFLFNFISLVQKFLTRFKLINIFYKFSPKYNINKRLKLISLFGLKKEDLSIFADKYVDYLLENQINKIQSIINFHQKNNDVIIIVSGGYEIYLKKYADKKNIRHVIGTKISFDKNELCNGIISGKDCMNESKILLLEKYLKKHSINYNNSIFYSDNYSDIPLFKWSDESIIVSKNISQKWNNIYNFKEIIWND